MIRFILSVTMISIYLTQEINLSKQFIIADINRDFLIKLDNEQEAFKYPIEISLDSMALGYSSLSLGYNRLKEYSQLYILDSLGNSMFTSEYDTVYYCNVLSDTIIAYSPIDDTQIKEKVNILEVCLSLPR